MAAKIRWSPRAASNLEDICNYIAKDSELYAALFAKKVNVIIQTIPQFPKAIESFIVLKANLLKLLLSAMVPSHWIIIYKNVQSVNNRRGCRFT